MERTRVRAVSLIAKSPHSQLQVHADMADGKHMMHKAREMAPLNICGQWRGLPD